MLLAGVACAQEVPPALPLANIVVDTNVDVPRTLARVRIDIYSEAGRWLHSRTYPLPRAENWPTSFSIVAPDDRATTVLVRVRAYAEGAERDYRGERYLPPPVFTPRAPASTLPELCETAPELRAHEELTLRIGPYSLGDSTCPVSNDSGVVAVRVEIPVRGSYRFGVVAIDPPIDSAISPSLFLRRKCDDLATEIVCDNPTTHVFPGFTVDLDPGTYTLLASESYRFERDEITLRWSAAADWGTQRVSRSVDVPPTTPPPPAVEPRLVVQGEDVTPVTEPTPEAAIERIVRAELVPGAPLHTRISLDGSCLGQPSKVAVRDDGSINADQSLTCEGGTLHGVTLATPLVGEPLASARGTFPPEEACTPEMSDERVVCVPGGTFVLGATETDLTSVAFPASRTLPLRAVALRRFFMDRYEITVGRYRQALGQGFASTTSSPPQENPNAIDPASTADLAFATFSAKERDRESYPLNYVTWDRARDICRFYAGDLPTEAQWEYAAVAVGRTRKATYPWGEGEPGCNEVVFGREPSIRESCKGMLHSPRPVDTDEGARDVTPLGIVGMAGSVAEYVRDTYAPYDADCWRAAPSLDPACIDDSSPYRVTRGNEWQLPGILLRAAYRDRRPASSILKGVGARCVYSKRPARRWLGP